MQFQIHLSKPINPLQLYRHLLREASYLPRPCRQYARGQIFHKFHKNQHRPTRVEEHIDDGYAALRLMRGANAGELDRMYRIALLTFGRLGEHRMRRLKSLMRPDGPKNSGDVGEEIEQAVKLVMTKRRERVPKRTELLEKWPLDKLKAYLVTQKDQQDLVPKVRWPKPEIPGVTPNKFQLPDVSVWGTKLSENGHRYRLASWWRQQKERILPPMTETRFSQLRDLANGIDNGKPLQVMPRRAVDKRYLAELKKEKELSWNFGAEIRASTALVERQKSRPFIRRSGLIDESPWRVDGQSPLTARNLQRIFRFVFYTASVSRLDPVEMKQKTAWGRVDLKFEEADKEGDLLFEGVSEETGFPEDHVKHASALKALKAAQGRKAKRMGTQDIR